MLNAESPGLIWGLARVVKHPERGRADEDRRCRNPWVELLRRIGDWDGKTERREWNMGCGNALKSSS